jgi:hypothetical protein
MRVGWVAERPIDNRLTTFGETKYNKVEFELWGAMRQVRHR